MHPTHRLFSIVQILRQAKKPVLAQALAEELEVSVRTIYRDINELRHQFVPIDGEAGVGYVLKQGFELPPLMLTPDELDAVLLGINWVSKRGDRGLASASKSVLNKVKAVVPEHLQAVALDPPVSAPNYSQVVHDDLDMDKVRMSIRESRKISIAYENAKGEASERILSPFMIAYFDTTRLISAWCELRSDFRHFRTDRILRIQFLDEVFDIPANELKARWKKQLELECARRSSS